MVAANERKLLEDNGVEIENYEKFNDDIDESTVYKRIILGIESAWSKYTYNELKNIIKYVHPDIAHIHSIHPQISPSAYAACQEMGVPVVHTLHNYRYLCPGALLQRDGRPCEDCVGRWPLKALRYKCYRGSLAATWALVWMISYNRWRGTFEKDVNRYIALTKFAANRLIAGGLPADRIEVKPNFLPNAPVMSKNRANYAVYVGRLSEEKGIRTLLAAWQVVSGLPLKVLGDGPLRASMEIKAKKERINVEFLGSLERKEVLSVGGRALLQIVPSECYEGFPMVILEALACGTPVVASRIGSLEEIISDGETGLHFEVGDPKDLAMKVNILLSNHELAEKLGNRAREIFLQKYTPEQNFKMLMGIYERAKEDFRLRSR
jgi:glycosyltransferase involved in cell wall biosynthesis